MDPASRTPAPAASDALRIVVIGGGIAGAETALTLATGIPDAHVLLVSRYPTLRVLPDLVYVPFGIDPCRIDVPLSDLVQLGVEVVTAEVERVDTRGRTVHASTGPIPYDVLVAAPGAQPRDASDVALRTLEDALRIRGQLAEVVRAARSGDVATITLQASSDDSWTAPACELAVLIGTWIRAMGVGPRVTTLLATCDRDPFEWFGPTGEVAAENALQAAGVQTATGIPAGRFDQLGGDVVIEFGPLTARRIEGLPGWSPSGWYLTSPGFRVSDDVFVIGDAVQLPYRGAFATAWQARRVLLELGGDLSLLGAEIDDIPVGAVEYQMDVGDGVLRARIPIAEHLAHPFLGHDADIDVVRGELPHKLAGLLVHQLVIAAHRDTDDAARSFRDSLLDAAAASSRT